ncbi:MAG: LPS-assembly protein LptD [Betaproteobacteria bacterium]|nr:LPS-assembly protein LptD [Betaproteobacteria bacterium]
MLPFLTRGFFIIFILLPFSSWAEESIDHGIKLQTAKKYHLALPPVPDNEQVVFIRGDHVVSQNGFVAQADGHAEARRGTMSLFADHIYYKQQINTIEATDHVHLVKDGTITVDGPHGILNMDNHQGYFDNPSVYYAPTPDRPLGSRVSASLMNFLNDHQEHALDSSYTTCPIGRDDWSINTTSMDLNQETNKGVAHNATIDFMGAPILYAPQLTFPINGSRQSGFLAPTIGASTSTGQDYAVPYYFNIAPNFDDTLTPRTMSARGIQLGNDFRYLEPTFSGDLITEILPHDVQTNTSRWFYSWKNNLSVAPGVGLSTDIEQVSDPNYFNDLSSLLSPLALAYLPRNVNLTYNRIPDWTINVQSISYQTLFGATPQYRMEPQINANYSTVSNDGKYEINAINQYTNFVSPGFSINGNSNYNGIVYNAAQQSVTSADRFVAYPSITLPFQNSYSFLKLKTGVNLTQYNLTEFANQAGYPSSSLTRTLPITSVDSGLIFERNDTLFGHNYTQTLEPRLYYLYIPYQNQSQYPVFDTSLANFDSMTIFSENQFNGYDRINNANQLTAAVTSRFIEPTSQIEELRLMVGQRFYFTQNQVLLPGEAAYPYSVSDYIAEASANINNSWKLSGTLDLNAQTHQTEQIYIYGNYSPAPGKLVNVGYQNNVNQFFSINPTITPSQVYNSTIQTFSYFPIRQWDISTEWPVTRQVSFLGRVSYSTIINQVMQGLMGIEYNQGCWALRLVSTRFAVSSIQTNSAFFIQLELGGLGLGQNPLQSLRLNIPGYVKTTTIDTP